MQYVQFGRSGLRVSRIAIGLGLRGQADAAGAERLINAAADAGINVFDCANVYGLMDDRANAGRSEEILGRALKGRRDDVVITSKVVSPVGSGPNDRGGSRYHILREVERSLRRLGTDRIDVYLLHAYDVNTPLEEQFRALEDLVRHGKVRYIGVCNYQAWQVCRALWVQDRLHATPLICIQNPYSLLNRGLETEHFPLVRELGLGVMAYAPLATGLLTGTYRVGQPAPAGSLWATRRAGQLEHVLAGPAGVVLTTVEGVARKHGAAVAEVALAWLLAHSEVSVAISGADTDQQLQQNLGALKVQLDADDLAALDAASAGLDLALDGQRFARPASMA